MTKETCRIRYAQVKTEEEKEFWKNRFLLKGGTLAELGIEEEKKEKKKGKD